MNDNTTYVFVSKINLFVIYESTAKEFYLVSSNSSAIYYRK